MMLTEEAADLILGKMPLEPSKVEFYRHQGPRDRSRWRPQAWSCALGKPLGRGRSWSWTYSLMIEEYVHGRWQRRRRRPQVAPLHTNDLSPAAATRHTCVSSPLPVLRGWWVLDQQVHGVTFAVALDRSRRRGEQTAAKTSLSRRCRWVTTG
jgi:hypothetical protein